MKTISITILLIMLAIAACSEKKPDTEQKPADTTAQVANKDNGTVTPVQSFDMAKAPEEAKPMLNDIASCLKSAVDNAKTPDDGFQALRACEQVLKEKYKEKIEKDPAFAKYFDEYGQEMYNKEKIRLKEKFPR